LNAKQFRLLQDRDGYCLHCGETERLSPNHRAGRGMGGSKQLDVPSNIVLLCSRMNFLIESDPVMADLAREHGWKLERWQDPKSIPVKDLLTGKSWLLDDGWARTVTVS
jgi:hypothetical protein